MRPPTSSGPQVAIVGGGISGLTAALRLAQRGYRVTVYEEREELGGNLGAHAENGAQYDVYPHMFSNFYENFWRMAEGDLKLTRGERGDFEPRTSVKILDQGAFPTFLELTNVGSFDTAWANVFSGVASPADMLLWAYSMVDGLSRSVDEDSGLDRVSVEGFLRTRPYATPAISHLHDVVLMTIWSVHAYETSAAAYRRFIDRSFPCPTPLTWLLTGDLDTKLIEPLRRTIESYGGVIRTNTRVVEILATPDSSGAPGAVNSLSLRETRFDRSAQRMRERQTKAQTVALDPARGDTVVLAVPPGALFRLLATGPRGRRLLDRAPALAEVRRLAAEPIPVLNLYLKKKLEGIPKECVLLRGSPFNLTFLDLSQLWHDDPNMRLNRRERTVLCVAASDYFALPTTDLEDEAQSVIRQVAAYLPGFEAGRNWRDPRADIDWTKTHFAPNTGRMLFANRPGGEEWQPHTLYPHHFSNLFFGGDSAVNPIRMATVESAVTSGLQAAAAVWARAPLGPPIEISTPGTYPTELIVAMKTGMAPWAYAAKFWSSASEIGPRLTRGDAQGAFQAALATAWNTTVTPALMAADLWQSMARLVIR
jgi:phytoene dehydrogenase-like protein